MGDVRIRTATIDDLSHILRHRREMFREMGHTDATVLRRMDEASEAYFRAAIPAGRYLAWMAEADGRIVSGGGVAVADWPGSPEFPSPRRGWILNIYTEPEFRRRGIARRIMSTIVEWCRAQGFVHVSLHAAPAGRPLYEAMGFRPTNEMRLYLE